MKYSPKVTTGSPPRSPSCHPLQHEETVQGVLEIYWRLERMLAEISGMSRVSSSPDPGRRHLREHRHDPRTTTPPTARATASSRSVTTMFSHPSNAACAKTAGYEVHHADAGRRRLPATSRRCAAAAVGPYRRRLMITNPEDTGIFNPRIREFARAGAHRWAALACYDQANANGILRYIPGPRRRVRPVPLQPCTRHASPPRTPAAARTAARGAASRRRWSRFLPARSSPSTRRPRTGWRPRPARSARCAPSRRHPQHRPRAYAWIMAMGAEGLRQVAETGPCSTTTI
ncbi:hypothetical protein [Nonomuraea dietziae]|uniref:hypothetical protein n=1 Tax=Nonomuraea dietziae TaxID=65515 RepID=UPI0031D8841A